MARPLPACRPGFTDHIFKTASGVSLPLRFWPPSPTSAPPSQRKPPYLLWIHGGGYTCGKWTSPTAWLSRAADQRGYALASVGYRLQPQASLSDMVADCVDAAAWCAEHLPRLHGVSSAWAVGGASSGATLAALTALAYTGSDTVKGVDAPAALFSVYGLLDTAHYCAVEGHAADTVGKEPTYVFPDKIDAAIADRDPANASVQAPWSSEIPPAVSLDEARAALGLADWEPDEGVLLRNDLYSYVAAHGNLMDILYRREKFPEGEKGREAFMRHVVANSPTQVLSARTTFPPTFLMHGDADSIVPASQTKDFAAHLSRLGVAHQVYYEPGAGHVYDFAFETPEDKGWAENVEPCMDFLDRHVLGRT